MLFAMPTDLWTTAGCVAIFLVISVGLLWQQPGRATVLLVLAMLGLLVGVILVVPEPWNLATYLLLGVGWVLWRIRQNMSQVRRTQVDMCDRPTKTPAEVDHLIH